MSRQYVEYVRIIPKIRSYENKQYYTYRPDRKWKRLQRLCFWILGKIGSYWIDRDVSYSEQTIYTGNIVDHLVSQKIYLLQDFREHGRVLLIGQKECMELCGAVEPLLGPAKFSVDYKYGDKINNLKIIVVPWMNGMVVLPWDVQYK